MSNRLTKFYSVPLPVTAEVERFLDVQCAQRKMSRGEFIAATFFDKYAHLRPIVTTPLAQDGEDTPAELHRLLEKFRCYPGYLAAWQELRWCTGKATSYEAYLAWIASQTKFIKRAGRAGGNQLLLYAVRQMRLDLEGATLTEQAVIDAAANARAMFAHPNDINNGNVNG